MLKLVFALRRRPELSLEDFQAYWREQHAPLVARLAAELGIRRYVQVHTLGTAVDAILRAGRQTEADPFDGVAELWWDSLHAFQQASATAAGRSAARILLEDEARFVDLPRSPLWFGEEHVVLPDAFASAELLGDTAPGSST